MCVCARTCVYVCVFVCIADKAIREMNRIEENIVRGYLNAVKYASLLESRVRIVLVGDTGSGTWLRGVFQYHQGSVYTRCSSRVWSSTKCSGVKFGAISIRITSFVGVAPLKGCGTA